MANSGATLNGTTLWPGTADGETQLLEEPLSFWGGFDVSSGLVVERRHPQVGESLAGRVVLMPSGRGSSSSSAVLAEAIRLGRGPAAVVLLESDPIVALGAIVAAELYEAQCPVVQLDPAQYDAAQRAESIVVSAGPQAATLRLSSSPRTDPSALLEHTRKGELDR
jgi:hypothetical protein